MQVSLIPVQMVDQVWPGVANGFQRASDRFGGDLTVGELWGGCRAGHCFLFVIHDEQKIAGATVWKPEMWASGTKFRCLGLYGKGMSTWLDDLVAAVAKVARDCGAEEAVFDGREGWFRELKGIRRIRSTFAIKVPTEEPV